MTLITAICTQSVRPTCLLTPPRLFTGPTQRCLAGLYRRHDSCRARKAVQLSSVSIDSPASSTFLQEAQPLRDYQIGAPYGVVCLAAGGLLGAPLLALAGAAVLGASLQSWQLEKQQQPSSGFQHWFAGALLMIAYQLGALAALPVAHMGVRLLLAATVLASALYGMSAAGTASPTALSSAARSSSSGSAGGGSRVRLIWGARPTGGGGMPPRKDEEERESNEQKEGHGVAGFSDLIPSFGKQQQDECHEQHDLDTLPLASHAVPAAGLLSTALARDNSGSGLSTALAGAAGTSSACPPDSPDESTPLGATEVDEFQTAADQAMIDQAVIDHAVHVAFEQERETMSELVTQAVEHEMEGMNEMVAQAVEQAMTDVHFDVKANLNTLVVITGVILYWRGVWTAWDELFGYGLWSEVGAIGIGLGIMLLFRLLKIPLAEGFPSG